MADALKVLGQIIPEAGDGLVPAYTAVTAVGTTISSIVVANLDATVGDYFTIEVAKGGVPHDNTHRLFYKIPIKPRSSRTLTLGITMASGDIMRVASTNGLLAFNIFGVEVS